MVWWNSEMVEQINDSDTMAAGIDINAAVRLFLAFERSQFRILLQAPSLDGDVTIYLISGKLFTHGHTIEDVNNLLVWMWDVCEWEWRYVTI